MSDSGDGVAQPDDPAFLTKRKRAHQELPALPRLLAVEVLLAEPEALQDDGLEACLYVLRDRLRRAGKS
ncbi:MAG: hypothetical protein ABSB59_08835 [Streptosporangiaceae bacterium]|jgi:hypothetical protein